ncbi:hypothetical protein J6590_024881 [Homalodisca vitripennis]|nr:hypothetical protein J6590_024881 [Homalodisca vitripennis]
MSLGGPLMRCRVAGKTKSVGADGVWVGALPMLCRKSGKAISVRRPSRCDIVSQFTPKVKVQTESGLGALPMLCRKSGKAKSVGADGV